MSNAKKDFPCCLCTSVSAEVTADLRWGWRKMWTICEKMGYYQLHCCIQAHLRFILALNLEGHQPVLCTFFSSNFSSMHGTVMNWFNQTWYWTWHNESPWNMFSQCFSKEKWGSNLDNWWNGKIRLMEMYTHSYHILQLRFLNVFEVIVLKGPRNELWTWNCLSLGLRKEY